MLIDWPESFDKYMDRLQTEGSESAHGQVVYDLFLAELSVLQDLTGEPEEESATLKRVRQSGEFSVWRVAHPFHPDVALRMIVWFPPQYPGEVVVALFAGDKVRMGDVFYDSVAARADPAIRQWLRAKEARS